MTTSVVRPVNGSSLRENPGGWAVFGTSGVTVPSILQDDSDVSYASGTSAGAMTMAMDNYTLASNKRCARIRARFRGKMSGAATQAVSWFTGNYSGFTDDSGNFVAAAWDAGDLVAVGSLNPPGSYFNGSWRSFYPNGHEWTQAYINNIDTRFFSTVDTATAHTAQIMEVYVDLDIRTQATVVTGAPTDLNTHWPLLSWTTTPNDGDVQTHYEIHIFDLNVSSSPVFADTVGRVYNSGPVAGAAATRRIITGTLGLANGNYRMAIEVAKDFNGRAWWSQPAYRDFVIAVTPAVPTALAPVAATLNTNTPSLQAHVVGPSLGTFHATAKAEFELASDSGFTTNIRQFVCPDSQLTTNGTVTGTVPSDQALYQGTWYLRARTVDQYGAVSAWTSSITIVIAHPPTTQDYAPTGGASVSYGPLIEFGWTFYDSSAGDAQSAYQVIVVDASGTNVFDTGKTTSPDSTAAFALDPSLKDQPLRWKVKVWDTDDIASTFSEYQAFVLSDVPLVSMVAPIEGDVVASPAPEIDWLFVATGSRVQVAWRVEVSYSLLGFLTPVYDSGWVAGTASSHILTNPAMIVNGGTYVITVSLRDNTLLEGSTSINVTTSWVQPAAPAFFLDASGYDDNGPVNLQWDNSAKDDTWYAWRVYRRRDDLLRYELLLEIAEDRDVYSFNDYLAPSNTTSAWVVVQVATRFGSQVESDRPTNELVLDPGGSKYWIISDEFKPDSVRLDTVTQDDPTEEYESAEMLIFGRGRKVDQGTRWGYRGELVARILENDRTTARGARLTINNLRHSQSVVFIRTPFGDVIKSQLGDTKFARDAGRGISESGTMTIPYVEIYE